MKKIGAVSCSSNGFGNGAEHGGSNKKIHPETAARGGS